MIPVYNPNREQLRAAIDSVLKERGTARPMQVELVDDCSPNPVAADLMRELAGEPVSLHRNSTNLGLAGTWNVCIDRARGDVVHILHQDDYVLPGFYASLEPAFTSPSVGAAFCRHAYVDAAGSRTGESELESDRPGILSDLKYRLASDSRVQCPAIVVRRSCYDAVGRFRTDLPYILDWEMWLRISVAWQVYYEPRVLACYRVHASNQTTNLQRTGEDVRDIGRFFQIAEAALPDRRGRDMVRRGRKTYARRALQIASSFIGSDEAHAAWAQVRAAWRLQPSVSLVPPTAKCGLKYFAGLLGRKPGGSIRSSATSAAIPQ